MKKVFLSILSLFLISTNYCLAETLDTNSFKTKLDLNVNSPQAVADKANKMYGNSDCDGVGNSFLNSPMGGYYNLMQGNSGNFSNNMQEMQKQQMDYTKQQMNNKASDED